MEELGRTLDEVRAALSEARARDFSYSAGQILGSMCTAPDEAALEAFLLFHETNLGDPGHFPGAASLEASYLESLLGLTHAPSGARGLFTSGGTESNVVAVYAAREAWRERTGSPQGRPNIVVPAAAHFSFEKARRLTDVEIRYAKTSKEQKVDPESVDALVDDDTCLIVGIAGTTEVGALDDIEALAAVARARGVPFHVDAALGGFILPFLAEAGRPAVAWDFDLEGVTSITMDPHKMGAAMIPGGILLMRDAADLARISVDTPYVTTDTQSGILGTRPGAGAAAAWAAAHRLGRAGYAEIVARCLDLTTKLRSALDAHNVEHLPGDLNVVLVSCPAPHRAQAELSKRGWRVNAVPNQGGIRIVVMPHVRWNHLEAFLPHLVEVVRDMSNAPATSESPEAVT